ncbi:ketopantoate reductase family protein [Marinobacter sp.]|uniref:ketopantoate reductase family protein n=1 Tax=Marinobacter sp. TaxID=50741 RepID=UPI003A93BDFA
MFRYGGINVELPERLVGKRWRKCLWNAPFNTLSVIANGADTRTLVDTDGGAELMRAMMREVMEVAAAIAKHRGIAERHLNTVLVTLNMHAALKGRA